MAVLFYNIFLLLFKAGTRVASLLDAKARQWVKGRKGIFEKLSAAIPSHEKIIWMHCSSLGEFEQGRPVLESIRSRYPGYKILLTFFSPSGYEVQKNYPGADWVFYLPMDGAKNARRFLEIVHPSLAIFVKYEFWYYYLKKIKYRNIPLLLISALFRKDMSFFKWYGALGQKMLSRFDHLFVQNESSKALMDNIGLAEICSVSGDTRFDRVIKIAEKAEPLPLIEQFIAGVKTIIAGSTWKEDELVLKNAYAILAESSLKLTIAPHEVNEKHISELKVLFPDAILYSQLISQDSRFTIPDSRILIIDNIGMLSRLYQYGYLAYVGGGFTKSGIHNVLEAAVYDKVVLFGPNYEKYSEAIGLVAAGGAFTYNDADKNGQLLALLVATLLEDKEDHVIRSQAAGNYVRSHRGATEKILRYIQEKRLLTS